MSKSLAPSPRYRIIALDAEGNEFECFTWTKAPEAGIERAKRDAVEFGRTDLTDFRAIKI